MLKSLREYWPVPLIIILVVAYWLLPIKGRVVILPGDEVTLPSPRFRLDPVAPRSGEPVRITVTDTVPWSFVLLTVDGRPAEAVEGGISGEGVWTWSWVFTAPPEDGYDLIFYHDCHTGCVERGRIAVGEDSSEGQTSGLPTKLGVVFPDLERDWQGRAGWVVEVTYARRSDQPYWGVDDLAARIAEHTAQGLRVIVRIDYDQGQSIPPTEDYLALTEYLSYVQRLARDERLDKVYAYVIGTGFNALDSNVLSPQNPVTPAWYARVFNGYGVEATHTDNAVQTIHAENANVRVLVGPVRAWNRDQDGTRTHAIDAPWLNYMNTLVALIDEATRAKAEAGVPLVGPDGFDVEAPGRPDVPEMQGHLRADEPRIDLAREAWDGAQAGFRIYEDWLEIINAYPTTQGLPVYIISTNTYDRAAEIPPAQNYPSGWLTTALEVVNEEPQIRALCWFLDYFPHDTQWDWFSLTRRSGRLVDAAEEFDALLRGAP